MAVYQFPSNWTKGNYRKFLEYLIKNKADILLILFQVLMIMNYTFI